MACRAAVTSDKRFHSLGQAESLLKASRLGGSGQKNALRALHILADAEG